MNRFRNTIAQKLCNFILKHVATADYRDTLGHLIALGMHTTDAARGNGVTTRWNDAKKRYEVTQAEPPSSEPWDPHARS
jgi:hypothetical protein